MSPNRVVWRCPRPGRRRPAAMRAMSVAGSRRRALRDFYLTPVASRPESWQQSAILLAHPGPLVEDELEIPNCAICGVPPARYRPIGGGLMEVECPRCGGYSVTDSAEAILRAT